MACKFNQLLKYFFLLVNFSRKHSFSLIFSRVIHRFMYPPPFTEALIYSLLLANRPLSNYASVPANNNLKLRRGAKSSFICCIFSHEASTSGYCSRQLKRNSIVVYLAHFQNSRIFEPVQINNITFLHFLS